MSRRQSEEMARKFWFVPHQRARRKRLDFRRGLQRWTATLALLGTLIWCASAQGITVLFTAANTTVTLGVGGLEFENPLNGTETVQGYRIIEWLDADYSAGPPRWYDDWTVSDPAGIDGNANEIWMRRASQWIQTASTLPSSLISIHLIGDNNDGLAEVSVDGVLVARLDMYTSPGSDAAFILVQALPNTAHTIEVADAGFGQGGSDVATFGAAALAQAPDLEFGDAPEGALAYPTSGINGGFPTCITIGPAGWIQHTNFGASFGPTFDFEGDGNAGLCPTFTPNQYDMDECFVDGDAGLLFPDPYTIQGPLGAEVVVPCPNSAGMSLGNICQTALWGGNLDIDVHNHMPNATVGYVNVLFDWDQNGIWSGASQCPIAAAPEHVLVNFPIPNPFDGPLSALNPPGFLIGPNSGYVWARFTITEVSVLLPWEGEGAFEDGETEDYLLQVDSITTDMDYGDAPDPTYPTLLASNGARHTVVPGYALGPAALALIDSEPDGQPSPLADGDDLNNLADEDGITFVTLPLIPGQQATIDVRNSMGAGGIGYLEGWVDFNGDGSWAELGDQVFFSQQLSPAPLNFDTFVVNVPASATPNIDTYARFRFSSNPNGYGFAGPATDGEVEDYLVRIGSAEPVADLGDAPDSTNNHGVPMTAYPAGGPLGVPANYPTVFQSVAAGPPGPIHHQPFAIAFLGNNVSLELEADIGPDQDPTNNIDPPGDAPDLDMFDDGVIFPVVMPHCALSSFDYMVNVVNPPVTALILNVWCDWNRDGDWDDVMTCPDGTQVPEWAVQNAALPLLPVGLQRRTTPTFTAYHPTDPPTEMWMRITLSDQPAPAPSGVAGEGGSGPAQGYLYGETEDYYFVPRVPQAKWVQPPHGPGLGFDAESDLFWPFAVQAVKWSQPFDPALPGLHAHDSSGGPGMNQFTKLADDFQCQGGDISDLHWWGNYELDPFGQEMRGSGIDHFHLSLHVDMPLIPWALPMDPEIWGMDVLFVSIPETATGFPNVEGSMIYKYAFLLPTPVLQTPGDWYWFDITAVSVDPANPALWRWQEAQRAPVPLGHAPAVEETESSPWRSISWPTIPETYSDMAFEITSTGPAEPNTVVADDFISDGRAIQALRWWGSYIDPIYDPFGDPVEPFIMDGWLISFHHAVPDATCPPDATAGDMPTALGEYFAPASAVTITPTGYQDCLDHFVYEYRVDLTQCCLVCSEADPRDGGIPADVDAFREVRGFKYWLDIQGVVGVQWLPSAIPPCAPILTGHLPSPTEPGGHFWGWHTSPGPVMPCQPMDEACSGQIVDFTPYPPDCWDYGNWTKQPWNCPPSMEPVQMAFELITTEPEPCPCPGDVNGDGVVNGLDIQDFCECLLGNPVGAGANCACCDYNCTKTPEVGDIVGFVAELLNTTVCP